VKFLRLGRHETDVGARAADARVPGEALAVIAETELAVCGMMTAVSVDEFGFAIALETRIWDDIERAVRSVAVFSGIAAALNLDDVNVFRIELRADVRGRCWCSGRGCRPRATKPDGRREMCSWSWTMYAPGV